MIQAGHGRALPEGLDSFLAGQGAGLDLRSLVLEATRDDPQGLVDPPPRNAGGALRCTGRHRASNAMLKPKYGRDGRHIFLGLPRASPRMSRFGITVEA